MSFCEHERCRTHRWKRARSRVVLHTLTNVVWCARSMRRRASSISQRAHVVYCHCLTRERVP